ncbi:hypothetical protein NDU88_006292 [Pleurodeles waltl]|uniref:Uncharacterized protein n=1 Tax=Pleurodeles waltl TaxID=8319 RepID=A0AAV7TDV2_PLEWA|nr:hypothetical protein NDU88_006292 [Pleurodeles waltl]
MLRQSRNQALLPSENSGERGDRALEERHLGGEGKMAAPTRKSQGSITIVSDDEGEGQGEQMSVDFESGLPARPLYTKDGRLMQFILRLVSPMLHKVQEWEVENQTVFKADKQVELMDSSGEVMRGTMCGEASGDGKAVYPVTEGELSTSRGAGSALEHIEEELLDYEDEEEVEEVERGHQRALQKDGTLEISHMVTKKAVQSDRPLGGHHQVFVTGNLPRDEEHRTKSVRVGCSNVGFDGVKKISGKDMGSQTMVYDKIEGRDASIQVGSGSEEVSGKSR